MRHNAYHKRLAALEAKLEAQRPVRIESRIDLPLGTIAVVISDLWPELIVPAAALPLTQRTIAVSSQHAS